MGVQCGTTQWFSLCLRPLITCQTLSRTVSFWETFYYDAVSPFLLCQIIPKFFASSCQFISSFSDIFHGWAYFYSGHYTLKLFQNIIAVTTYQLHVFFYSCRTRGSESSLVSWLESGGETTTFKDWTQNMQQNLTLHSWNFLFGQYSSHVQIYYILWLYNWKCLTLADIQENLYMNMCTMLVMINSVKLIWPVSNNAVPCMYCTVTKQYAIN
jgi:hypothetical protein